MKSVENISVAARRRRTLSRALARVCALVAACFLAASLHSPRADAATSSPLTVGVAVQDRCSLLTTPLNFGTYDPQAITDLDVSGAISLSCQFSFINFIMHLRLSQGLQPEAGSTAAAPLRQMTNGTDMLRYNLYTDTARADVWGDTFFTAVFPGFGPYPMNIPLHGRIPAGQNVSVGTYLDTVTATLWF